MGNLSSGLLYRASYPVFKEKERDDLYNRLVAEAGIKCVLNLADSQADLDKISCLLPWYDRLVKTGNVIGLGIQFDFDFCDKFGNEVFRYKLREGFKFMISHDGPFLIHCRAGNDRTGFFMAILGLLFGASIDEVIYDYLLSLGKEVADAKDKGLPYITGRTIYGQINAIINRKITDSSNLQLNIEKYFLNDIGLTIEELQMLKCMLRRK